MQRARKVGRTRRATPSGPLRREILERGGLSMLLLSIVAMLSAGLVLAWAMSRVSSASGNVPQSVVFARTRPTPTRDPGVPAVGIVAGHAGYDPGAVCPSGLTEAEVNLAIAEEVIYLLKRRGIQADLLEEFDPRLNGYRANALVSIHADSCNVPGASGFKVARVTESAIPAAEDQLVACLNQEYATYTGLPQHPASITDNMTDYHAFREIDPLTPGAIIETGFLLDDSYLLVYRPKVVARGIASGIVCFLDSAPQ